MSQTPAKPGCNGRGNVIGVVAKIRGRLENKLAPAMGHGHRPVPIAVCECNAWKGFMIEAMYPDATRIRVRPGQPAEEILNALPRDTRGVVMHLDASVTSDFLANDGDFRADLAARGVRTINIDATDIRKSTIHARCSAVGLPMARADRDGPGDERVIIKTTLNSGGGPEHKLARQWGASAARVAADVSDVVRGSLDYVICRRDEVPAAVWTDSKFVVERFIENPEGVFFRVYVVGPAGVVSAAWTDRQIKKLSMPIRARENYYYWTGANGHTALGSSSESATRALTVARRLAESLNVELCGADCVMDTSGNVVPIDINKTPYWGKPRTSPILAHLLHGFDHLMNVP